MYFIFLKSIYKHVLRIKESDAQIHIAHRTRMKKLILYLNNFSPNLNVWVQPNERNRPEVECFFKTFSLCQ